MAFPTPPLPPHITHSGKRVVASKPQRAPLPATLDSSTSLSISTPGLAADGRDLGGPGKRQTLRRRLDPTSRAVSSGTNGTLTHTAPASPTTDPFDEGDASAGCDRTRCTVVRRFPWEKETRERRAEGRAC